MIYKTKFTYLSVCFSLCIMDNWLGNVHQKLRYKEFPASKATQQKPNKRTGFRRAKYGLKYKRPCRPLSSAAISGAAQVPRAIYQTYIWQTLPCTMNGFKYLYASAVCQRGKATCRRRCQHQCEKLSTYSAQLAQLSELRTEQTESWGTFTRPFIQNIATLVCTVCCIVCGTYLPAYLSF